MKNTKMKQNLEVGHVLHAHQFDQIQKMVFDNNDFS